MSDSEATNPVADEPVDGLEAEGVVEAPEGDDEQLDADGNPIGTDDDDSEELEHDGQKFKLPKDIAAAIKPSLMMHADYTRKTQEVAEARRALDAERSKLGGEEKEISELRATLIAEERQAATLDQQLAEYRKVTPMQWATWQAQDPAAYNQARLQYEALKDARAEVDRTIQTGKTSLSERTAKALEQQRETHAKQIQEGQAVLARDIKGWGPERAAKLVEFAEKKYGISGQQMAQVTDPRLIKILNDAYVNTQAEKTKQVKAQAQKTAAVAPTPKVGIASAPPKGLDDRLSTAEWARRRNEQVAARNRR